MNFHCITLFPESFDSYINESIIGRAIGEKKININFYNPRLEVRGKYRKKWPDGNVSMTVDERPYGGGPGMVIMAEPMLRSVDKIIKKIEKRDEKEILKKVSKKQTSPQPSPGRRGGKAKIKIVFFAPDGEQFTTSMAKIDVKKYTDIIFICGRYEGIDNRVIEALKKFKITKVSIGDYVLTGGELPAMVCIDCISRQIPGVLGNFDSREEERVSSHHIYTRPEVLEWQGKKYSVPPVLLSGDHKKIDEWKTGKN
jgi:tRNA (guanine37-N1)-methyltransferase